MIPRRWLKTPSLPTKTSKTRASISQISSFKTQWPLYFLGKCLRAVQVFRHTRLPSQISGLSLRVVSLCSTTGQSTRASRLHTLQALALTLGAEKPTSELNTYALEPTRKGSHGALELTARPKDVPCRRWGRPNSPASTAPPSSSRKMGSRGTCGRPASTADNAGTADLSSSAPTASVYGPDKPTGHSTGPSRTGITCSSICQGVKHRQAQLPGKVSIVAAAAAAARQEHRHPWRMVQPLLGNGRGLPGRMLTVPPLCMWKARNDLRSRRRRRRRPMFPAQEQREATFWRG